ncbi:MAG: hypothetical protein OZ948_17165 [Deltaproteobacteria bacterium]|nr:hypothetical protein [Deltaproteobacteria bacterium]
MFERSVVAGGGLVYYGPIAHHLGLLASTRGRVDDALRRFEQALAAEARAGARLWVVRTGVAQAHALLAREAPGDRARAAQALAKAREHALGRPLPELERELDSLEATLWAGSSSSTSTA